MAEERRFPRYDVAQHPKLHGYIEEDDAPEQLITIGLGGCGFFGENEKSVSQLREGKQITCTFEMEGVLSRPVKVPGNVAYAYAKKSANHTVMFCGVEFDEAYQDKIKPIIRWIENERNAKTASPA